MSVDQLFETADKIISSLPTREASETFYDLVDVGSPKKRQAWSLAAEQLLELASHSPYEKSSYFLGWAADAFTGLGDFEQAIKIRPPIQLGSRSSMQTDRLLTLKLTIGQQATGHDVTTLFSPKLTKFGRQHLDRIVEFLDIRVHQLQTQEHRNLIAEWVDDAYLHPAGMTLFSGHASYILLHDQPAYHFSLSKTAELVCAEWMRDAENTLREEQDIPKVGEGWVAETALFYAIKSAFPNQNVVQHGRPACLGRQHLDIFFPDLNIALEYQGEQHDRPIAFFGGDEAFLRNVERDKRKLRVCTRHGIRIIYVRAGYSLAKVVAEVEALQR
jgi:hypothetical protein